MVVEDETEDDAGYEEVFNFECVNGRVVSWSGSRGSTNASETGTDDIPEPDSHEI